VGGSEQAERRGLEMNRMLRAMSTTTGGPSVAPTEGGTSLRTARAVVRAGFVLGLSLAMGAAVEGAFDERNGRAGLAWSAAFTLGAALLLLLLPRASSLLLLGAAGRPRVTDTNLAAAVALSGNRIAVGVVLSHCFYGADLPTLLTSLSFVVVSFVALVAMQWLYVRLTHYSDSEEIEGGNAAAALCFAGVTIAFSIIVGNAVWGEFTGWRSSLTRFGVALLLALGLYPVRQLVVRGVLLGLRPTARGGELDHAIAQDRDVAVGAVEGLAYIAAALLLTGVAP
jgi:uncharacterized membrane protein YjfL (UPF0719 family)